MPRAYAAGSASPGGGAGKPTPAHSTPSSAPSPHQPRHFVHALPDYRGADVDLLSSSLAQLGALRRSGGASLARVSYDLCVTSFSRAATPVSPYRSDSGVPLSSPAPESPGDAPSRVSFALGEEQRQTKKPCKGPSVYVGKAGVAWSLAKSAGAVPGDDTAQETLKEAMDLATEALEEATELWADDARSYALLDGLAGAAVARAAIAFRVGDTEAATESLEVFSECQPPAFSAGTSSVMAMSPVAYHAQPTVADEILYGRAGYLLACCALCHVVPAHDDKEFFKKTVGNVARDLMRSGRLHAEKVGIAHRCPLYYDWHNVPYLGFAHGLMGILFSLMTALPLLAVEDATRVRNEIHTCLTFVLTHERDEGKYPTRCIESFGTPTAQAKAESASEGLPKMLCHWCHGSTGAAMLFAKAAHTFTDDSEKRNRYASAALRAGDVVWREGLLKKGVGLCHGVAGNGYALLACSRLPSVEDEILARYAHRARMFADWIVSDEGQSTYGVPDHAASLFEGLAGASCFVMDVDDRGGAGLPFVETFSFL
ncbi:hypothetical protein PPROV_000064300 [Pycnococcus provasolii]|uniref:Uncharacterized protein n=1 Tax=Pycnococcus provasolii TaxID=41880 RepID=A0A830H430_9CHLO|nr:hypothetical protein PPROV_000064300 [Pycnococcus provasolii]